MNILEAVIIVVFVLIFLGFLSFKIYKYGLRTVCIELIVKAEKNIKDNQGKFDMVVNGIVQKIPFPLNIFFTKESIENFVQNVFDEIKIALDYREEQ